MLRFVDLETGNVFNGDAPYIHWFDGEQSTGLIYVKKLCFITDKPNVEVSIEENSVYSLIEFPENVVDGDSMDINNIKVNETISRGVDANGHYVHMVYLVGQTFTAGEYIVDIIIDGSLYKVGADFYDENESLYVNLMNRGAEIPREIQKAFYNVHTDEAYHDNITLNRKWKELLSNFWDIMDNKGSYKSLVNSLKWFEYGDKLNSYEVWRFKDGQHEWFCIKDLQDIMSSRYSMYQSNFKKTTYIALTIALKTIKDEAGNVEWGEDGNPITHKSEYVWGRGDLAFKWTLNEIALKLSLLGKFFQAYFMPIHLNLFYSALEDIVYTPTNKVLTGSGLSRTDLMLYIDDMTVNVHDGDIFPLANVSCQVSHETMFGTQYSGQEDYDDVIIVGVDDVVDSVTIADAETFYSQLYTGVGCVVPFEVSVPLQSVVDNIEVYEYDDKEDGKYYFNGLEVSPTAESTMCKVREFVEDSKKFVEFSLGSRDSIKRSIVHLYDGGWKYNTDYRIISTPTFSFNLLCKTPGKKQVRFQFETLWGHVYTKLINFRVEDDLCVNFDIKKLGKSNDRTKDPFESDQRWMFSDKPVAHSYKQYLPTTMDSLNHMIIVEGEKTDMDGYYRIPVDKGDQKYTVFIRTQFGEDEGWEEKFDESTLYRTTYVFCPGWWESRVFGVDGPLTNDVTLDNFTIMDGDILWVQPTTKYSHDFKKCSWEFINVSTGKTYTLPSSQEPFVAPTENEYLPTGFYDIVFRYKLGNEMKEVRREGAFYKK